MCYIYRNATADGRGSDNPLSKTERGTPRKILDAAIGLVVRNGYANVSMRDVAREAGVSISQISYYYRNKDGLFYAMMKELKETIIADISEGVGGVTDTEKFAEFLCAYAKNSISTNVELHRLRTELSNLAMNSESFGAEFRAVTDELAGFLAARLEACEPCPKLLAFCGAQRAVGFIIAVFFGVSTQYLISGRDPKTLETIDVLKDLLR